MSIERLSKRLGDKQDGLGNKPVIVIIDDDAQVIQSLTVVLRSHYQVRGFSDPVQGAREGARSDVAAVVLDVRMPERDGFWVFDEIRKTNANVPIIFNSAYQDALTADAVADRYKSFGYFSKTGDMKVFLARIALAVANRNPPTGSQQG